jgi:hypothetical protein
MFLVRAATNGDQEISHAAFRRRSGAVSASPFAPTQGTRTLCDRVRTLAYFRNRLHSPASFQPRTRQPQSTEVKLKVTINVTFGNSLYSQGGGAGQPPAGLAYCFTRRNTYVIDWEF